MDKLKNKLQMGKGRAKEETGRVAGDPYLEAEGKGDRVSGAAKQVGEQVKDAGKNIRDAFKKEP
ncbi:MAG TPA: CsbD family protein [Streptosporangiaceae bacterium]|nr:CsbD family protein [Streptosporangiaceae bacterium]